jgi:DNA-binding response OmpR family regulator
MNGARILIVEDEPVLMRGLRDVFTRKGFEVLAATNGAAGLTTAVEQRPDLILLDLMLPKVNGYEVCRVLRQKGLKMPILMLTAKAQEEDIVLGLNLGADDYITKPFRIAELTARVNAFLRRSRPEDGECVFGPFRLDVEERTLYRGTEVVPLTAKESALLAYLAARPGRTLSREMLIDGVWGRTSLVTGRSVDRCVATLRAKIEEDPRNPAYVHTVRDMGYRFEPEVTLS